jgi:hypothetical protein
MEDPRQPQQPRHLRQVSGRLGVRGGRSGALTAVQGLDCAEMDAGRGTRSAEVGGLPLGSFQSS